MTDRQLIDAKTAIKYATSALKKCKALDIVIQHGMQKARNYLYTPAGTVDLRTGTMRSHNPDDLITKITAVSPDDVNLQMWLDAIETFFCGNEQLISYIQEIVGLAAIGKVFMEAIIIAYGNGSNGKSTFWNTIARVLGDNSYSGKISAGTLTLGYRHNVKAELAEMCGKRLNA